MHEAAIVGLIERVGAARLHELAVSACKQALLRRRAALIPPQERRTARSEDHSRHHAGKRSSAALLRNRPIHVLGARDYLRGADCGAQNGHDATCVHVADVDAGAGVGGAAGAASGKAPPLAPFVY